MFRQLVAGTNSRNCINSLFLYHPLQISAIAETVWLNRNNAGGSSAISPFVPWPPQMVYPVLKSNDFFPGYAWSGGTPTQLPIPLPAGMAAADLVPPVDQPGIKGAWDGMAIFPPPGFKPTYWDHLIYAYV